jgi:hypothetical protein
MLNNKFETYILVKPYGFCNRGYHCHDIVVASCKHTFHPFCLGELLRVNNKCFVCAQVFHLDWWHSWGFQEEDVDMCVDELQVEMKQTFVIVAFCPRSSSVGLN